MLTVLAGSILFVVCAFIGSNIKKYYKIKMTVLNDIKDFCEFARSKISLLKQPVDQIIYEYASIKGKESAKYLSQIAKYIDQELKEIPECLYLDKSENKAVGEYFTNMGKNDYKNELNNLDGFKIKVTSMYENSVSLYKNKGVLYYKLSVFAGIALMLLVC